MKHSFSQKPWQNILLCFFSLIVVSVEISFGSEPISIPEGTEVQDIYTDPRDGKEYSIGIKNGLEIISLSGTYTLPEAYGACPPDWRLPSKEEISGIKNGTYLSCIQYWTSSASDSLHYVYQTSCIDFGAPPGGLIEVDPSSTYAYVICVRTPTNTPIADFFVEETEIEVETIVEFFDLSQYSPNSWRWNFGDGTISTEQNPVHIYYEVGTFSVQLIVENLYGSDTINKQSYINVISVRDSVKELTSNPHFEIWGFPGEQAAADTVISILSENYNRIATSLGTQLSQIVRVDIYPDLDSYHTAMGWTDAPDWSVGSAIGEANIRLVTPFNPGPAHTFASIMEISIHEMIHCFVSKISNYPLPIWINEGTATYYAYQGPPSAAYLQSLIAQNGGLPTLSDLNNGSTFGDIGGYSWSHTIVEFIVEQLGTSTMLSQFLASNTDYSILGFSTEQDFETAWHNYINSNDTEQANITFKVDLKNQPEVLDGVYFKTSIDNWNELFVMTQSTNNGFIYELSLEAPVNTTVEYKFRKDQWWETINGDCTVGNFANRTVVVDTSDIILDAVCFAECNICQQLAPVASIYVNQTYGVAPLTLYFSDVSSNNPDQWLWDFGDGTQSTEQHPEHTYQSAGRYPVTLIASNNIGADTTIYWKNINVAGTTVDVTFHVNMSKQGEFYDNVYLRDSYSNWGRQTLMTDNGNGIYSCSVPVAANDTLYYIFQLAYDNEPLSGVCAVEVDGYMDRVIQLGNQDTILEPVCFGECENCPSHTLTCNDVTITNGEITACSYDFSLTDIIIPDTLCGEVVTGIGLSVFENAGITSVVLPTGLQYIKAWAFYSNNLSSVDFSPCSNLQQILDGAFYNNSMVNLDLRACSNLTKIGSYAFRNNNLENVWFPVSITELGSASFNGNNITQFNDDPFDGCFYAYKNDSTIDSSTLVSFGKRVETFILPSNAVNIANIAFIGCDFNAVDFSQANLLEKIGLSAFDGNNIASIDLSSCIRLAEIGERAFNNNLVLGFNLPNPIRDGYSFENWIDNSSNDYAGGTWSDNLSASYAAVFNELDAYTLTCNDVTIQNGKIAACSYNLEKTDIIVPDTLCGQLVTGIGSRLFRYKNVITSVQFPSSLVIIEDAAFEHNHIELLDLRKCTGLTSIGENAFLANSIKKVFLPQGLTSLGGGCFNANNISEVNGLAFNDGIFYALNPDGSLDSTELISYGNRTASVTIPAQVTRIANNALNGIGLTSVDLSQCLSLNYIGYRAFFGNQIPSIDLSFSRELETIDNSAFLFSGLNSIDLSSNTQLNYLGAYAFNDNNFSSLTLPIPEKEEFTFNFWKDGSGQEIPGGTVVSDLTTSYTADFTEQSNNVLLVSKVENGLSLDGDIWDPVWNLSTAIQISNGNSNNEASFDLLWDNNYLYVAVNVVDATLSKHHRQGWYDDGVEIAIDGNANAGDEFDTHDILFLKPIKSFWVQERTVNDEGIIHKYFEQPLGYSMEFAIPWQLIQIDPTDGISIGFNIIVNDDDLNNEYNLPGQLLWKGDADYYKTPAKWGTVELSEIPISYSGKSISLEKPNGDEFFVAGQPEDIMWTSTGISLINIEYSYDNGENWITLVSNVPASQKSLTEYWNHAATENALIRIVDAEDSNFSDTSNKVFTVSSALTPVEPLIKAKWENYKWPYNAYYPDNENGINGKIGNACGPSTLARIMHSWGYPLHGNGELTFTDNGGNLWSANFGEASYEYNKMPDMLNFDDDEATFSEVAELCYHAAVSMHDVGGSGTDLQNMSNAMRQYFNYKQSTISLRNDFTRAEWIKLLMNELDNGRSLLVQGMRLENVDGCGNWHENNCIAGHWYHCDGYNEKGEFHIVVGFGNFSHDGYFDVDEFSLYSYNTGVLIGLEPNQIIEKPIADFIADVTSGEVPLTVNFDDLSTSSETITSWYWDFGDGNTSTSPNPSHTYQSAGTYPVSLTVTSASGDDIETKQNYISVITPEPQIELNSSIVYNDLCNQRCLGQISLNYTITGTDVTDHGLYYSMIPDAVTNGTKISYGSGSGTFDAVLEELCAGSYYIVAYAQNSGGVGYSSLEERIVVMQPDLLTLNTNSSTTSSSISLELMVSGGTPGFMYKAILCDAQGNNCQEKSWQQSNTLVFDGLQPSTTYTVETQVQDANGCISNENVGFVETDASICNPSWSVINYTNTTTAYCKITIEGIPAAADDKIGAFINGECRGIGDIVIENGIAFSTILIQGETVETVTFKVWDASDCTERDVCGSWQTNPGSNIGYPPDFLITDVCTEVTQTVVLNSGWNLKSFYVDTEEETMGNLFDGLNVNVLQIKTMTNSWDPSVPSYLNTLTTLSNEEIPGFFIKAGNTGSFDITGLYIGKEHMRPLINSGWSLIGYPFNVCQSVEAAYDLLITNNWLEQVKNMTKSFDPDVPSYLNTLTDIEPGEGYFIKVNTPVSNFVYPEPTGCTKSGEIANSNECNWEFVGSPESMIAYGKVTFDDLPIMQNAYIGAFVGEECRALAPLILHNGESFVSMVINGTEKENVEFRLWKDGVVFESTTSLATIPGGSTGSVLPINFNSQTTVVNSEMVQFTQLNTSPNPFKRELNINVTLAEPDEFEIKIYSADSRLIKVYQKQNAPAGSYNFIWDAKGYDGNICAPGMYFIHLNSSRGNNVEKVIFAQ